MKPVGLVLIVAAALGAQDADRTTVPFSNPDGPKRVEVNVVNGSIHVKAHAGKDVIVEAAGPRSRRRDAPPPPGMRRIDMGTGLAVEESGNTITVKTPPSGGGEINITVPAECSLKLSTINNGSLSVEGVSGDIDASNLNGEVSVRNVSGSVVAHSLNGRVLVSLNQVTPGKAMSFSTLNGNVDVTLPADVKANVRMKSQNGEIWSDFDIQLNASNRTPVTEGGGGKGKYKVKFDRAMTGAINGGGAEIQFTTLNGTIYIRKKQ